MKRASGIRLRQSKPIVQGAIHLQADEQPTFLRRHQVRFRRALGNGGGEEPVGHVRGVALRLRCGWHGEGEPRHVEWPRLYRRCGNRNDPGAARLHICTVYGAVDCGLGADDGARTRGVQAHAMLGREGELAFEPSTARIVRGHAQDAVPNAKGSDTKPEGDGVWKEVRQRRRRARKVRRIDDGRRTDDAEDLLILDAGVQEHAPRARARRTRPTGELVPAAARGINQPLVGFLFVFVSSCANGSAHWARTGDVGQAGRNAAARRGYGAGDASIGTWITFL